MKKNVKKPAISTRVEKLEKQLKEAQETISLLLDHKTGQVFRAIKEPETFEDCIRAHSNAFTINAYGNLVPAQRQALGTGCFVPSGKRAKQLAAIAKMMTVADALDGGLWFIRYHDHKVHTFYGCGWPEQLRVGFATQAKAEKAIKILGEETIKTAFGL